MINSLEHSSSGEGSFLDEEVGPCPCCFPVTYKTYAKGSKGLTAALKRGSPCYVKDGRITYFVNRVGHVHEKVDGVYSKPVGWASAMFGTAPTLKGRRTTKKRGKLKS